MKDTIYRQAAIDEVRNYYDPEDHSVESIEDRIKKLPSAQPERKKPDHGYMWICPECGLEVHSDFARCVRCGWERTSAEPERKKGRWINDRLVTTNGGTYAVRRCPFCESYYQDVGYGWDYCPNCGADMRGEEK